MRIVIVATGSWGDVRPNGVVGHALQKAGDEVLLVAAEAFREWVEGRPRRQHSFARIAKQVEFNIGG